MSNLQDSSHLHWGGAPLGDALPGSAIPQDGLPQVPRPASVAESHSSVLSEGALARRAAMQRQLDQELAAERTRRVAEMERQLREQDEASLAGKQGGRSVKLEQPHQSAVEAEAKVTRREMEDLAKRHAVLARILRSKHGKEDNDLDLAAALSDDVLEDDETDEVELAATSIKVKVTAPEKWKGRYDYVKREAWIRTVEGFLASLGFKLTAKVDRIRTAYPHYILRSLFSSDSTDGLSALAWFDSRDVKKPFQSAQQVLDAIQAHWRDDTAGEATLEAYRSATQGSLRARDFGARVDTLADASQAADATQRFAEADRMATFTWGLNLSYKDFVKTQLATLSLVGRTPTTLLQLVDVAAAADGLDSFASSLKTPRGVHSNSSTAAHGKGTKKTTGTDSSSAPTGSGSKGEKPLSSDEKTQNWRSRAATWQSNHPLSSSSYWRSEGDKKPDQKQYCYNCGRLDDHFSRACPNNRSDPRGITLAAVFARRSAADSHEPVEYGLGKADEA